MLYSLYGKFSEIVNKDIQIYLHIDRHSDGDNLYRRYEQRQDHDDVGDQRLSSYMRDFDSAVGHSKEGAKPDNKR